MSATRSSSSRGSQSSPPSLEVTSATPGAASPSAANLAMTRAIAVEDAEPHTTAELGLARTSSPPPSTRKRLLQNSSEDDVAEPSPSATPHSPSPDDAARSGVSDTEDDDDRRGFPQRVGRVLCRQQGEASLLVSGRRFIVRADLFEAHPDTLLGRMLGPNRNSLLQNESGDYLLEAQVSPEAFSAVLGYYKVGHIRCPPTVSIAELREVCEYFCIPFNDQNVRCQDLGQLLHELSNEGGMRQFEVFLQRSLIPCMAKFAEMGERQCHIVVLADYDTVEWDDDFPPQLGEQFARVVHDSSLLRFLYSYENRSLAKRILKERGLKKIKVGIEGFPTFAERTKRNATGHKIEVEYHYDQRPFLRGSWEKEESKSRHVDFQYVRTPTTTNVLSTVMTS